MAQGGFWLMKFWLHISCRKTYVMLLNQFQEERFVFLCVCLLDFSQNLLLQSRLGSVNWVSLE